MSPKRKRTIAVLTTLGVAVGGLGVGSALAQSGKSTSKTGTTGTAKTGTTGTAKTGTTGTAKTGTTKARTSTTRRTTPRASSARAVTRRPRLTG
jgi:hypothetical protein